MVKRVDLERHLRSHDCWQVREGAKHSLWLSGAAERPVTVPRHRQLPSTTARLICKQLGVPAL